MTHKMSAISLNVKQKDIYYISWIIDACEGLGLLKTDDPVRGEATVFTPSELLEDMLSCIEGLRAEGIEINVTGICGSIGEDIT